MSTHFNTSNYRHAVVGIFAVSAVLAGMWLGSVIFKSDAIEDTTSSQNTKSEKETPKQNPFENISLQARAAVVYDMKNKEMLFAENQEAQLPLASLTKLMTALLAKETLEDGHVLEISASAIQEEGNSGLFLGEKWRVKELIDFTLLTSSNDGAYALAEAVKEEASPEHSEPSSVLSFFADLMNVKSTRLHLAQTYFLNSSGLDSSASVSGAYGSAKDVALLFSHIYTADPALLEATRHKNIPIASVSGFIHNAENTNEIVEKIPGIAASKTGFTDLAGGNLGIIFEAGPMRPFAVVVLGSSEKGRFQDIEALVDATLAYLVEFQ